MSTNSDKQFLEHLSRSKTYREYEHAFGDATGLPVALRPLQSWQLPHRGRPHENPFCAMMAKANRTCAACLYVAEKIMNPNKPGPQTAACFAGLTDTAVPVRLGERTVGFLVTGQVALAAPTRARFRKVAAQLDKWEVSTDRTRLEAAYLQSRTLPPERYNAMVRLLEIFGRNLSTVANQVALQESEAEPPLVRRARAFIAGHHADPVTLGQVAASLHVSTFYFCKVFKKATGLTFTDYLGRVRVEKARALLVNPNLRVSEIAYDVGFQSLTHFNRVFSRLVGCSPSAYRASLPVPRAGALPAA